jgi:TRAP-type C4-dicarboxylate transport system substrate-binding protein
VRDSWEELQKGTADIVVISAHTSPGVKTMPLFITVNNGWIGVKDVRTQLKIMKQLFKEFPELLAEWSAVKPLTWHGTLEITLHTKKRVQTLADLKGMQIKGVGTWPKYTVEKLGASLVAIPAAEVYLALQKGIVDGILLEASVLKSFRLAEVTQYTTNIGGVYTGLTTSMCVNLSTWKKLPPHVQKLFEEMGEWMNERQLQIREALLKEALEFAKEKKHEFTTLPPRELERLHTLLREEAFEEAKKIGAKEPQARKILTRMHELIKQTR